MATHGFAKKKNRFLESMDKKVRKRLIMCCMDYCVVSRRSVDSSKV